MIKWWSEYEDTQSWRANIGRFQLRVHSIKDQHGWHMTCFGVFDRMPLLVSNLEEAKTRAIEKLRNVLEEAINQISTDQD